MSEVAIYKKAATMPNPKTPTEIVSRHLEDGEYLVIVDGEVTSKILKAKGSVTVTAYNWKPERSFGE